MDSLVNSISPLAIDAILAILILLVACLKAKAGIYQSIMSAAVIVLALAIGFLGARWLKDPVSDYVWTQYGPKVERKFDEKVSAATSGEKSSRQVLQDAWNNIIDSFDVEQLRILEIQDEADDVDYQNSAAIQKLKAISLAKSRLLCDKVCQFALFGVITAIALLVLTIIKNIIGKLADFSIIGWANHLLGFAFGAVEMIVIMLVIVRGAGLIGIHFFQDMSEDTVLLKWLVGGNLETALYSIQHLSFEDIKNINIDDLTTVDFKSVGNQVEDLLKNLDLSGVTDKAKGMVDVINQSK